MPVRPVMGSMNWTDPALQASGSQPFTGWKGSGSSGKASGGLYYVQQFMREQSRTIVR